MAFDYTNYKQVEYLQSDASTSQTMHGPYIDLGLSGGHYRVIVSGCYTKYSQYVQYLYGYAASYSSEFIRQNANASASNIRAEVRGANTTQNNIAINTDHIIELAGFVNNAYLSIDGNTQTMNVTQDFTVGNRYLFAGGTGNGPTGVASFKMYYCRIYDIDDSLIMELIPCQDRTTLKYGLYDTVGETFYGTQNSYDFTGGPEVSGGPETYIKISGVWKKADAVYIKVGGTWTEGAMNVKVSGTWKDS